MIVLPWSRKGGGTPPDPLVDPVIENVKSPNEIGPMVAEAFGVGAVVVGPPSSLAVKVMVAAVLATVMASSATVANRSFFISL